MHKVMRLFSISLLGLLLAGCSTAITNLTPAMETRNADGSYRVEAALNSSEQTMRWNSIKPTVLVGKDVYTMQSTTLMTNRWETLVPAIAGTKIIYYRFKFDYNYNAWGSAPKMDSKLSPIYRLEITDK
jgi:hypothetical protein